MLLNRIIPCLDVDRGRVVKGINFVALRDMGDPVELAAQYEAEGADEVVFLDISASAENRATALDMVRRTAATLSIPFTLGGGLRTVEDAYAFCDNLKKNGVEVVREPGPMKHGTTVIAFAKDPDGYMVELIQP